MASSYTAELVENIEQKWLKVEPTNKQEELTRSRDVCENMLCKCNLEARMSRSSLAAS
jgi:hypothetical protein